MINEVAIRCFLSLAETLNFTETAKRMYMTQQSVSKYIAKLEDSLGFKLFIRTHHYVSMTKAGENYYKLFSEFAESFARVSEETRLYYGDMFCSVRIGYLEMLEITSQMGRALKELNVRFPDIHTVNERHPQYELIEQFLARKLDIIITYKEFTPKTAGIRKTKVLDTPLVLLVSPDNPKVHDGATYADFKGEPFIKAAASHESASDTRARAMRQVKELGFTPSDIIIAPNIESAYMATELGQGVFVSTMLSRMSLHSELICYPIGKTEELQCFWFENQENPAVRAFAEIIEEQYAPEPGTAE
ncbi:MAG: LysR family transcriptional regulator [Oscillospiraceae bacterium]|nr:LysR family transcriptional regulator [Oscillospiraceae bacterium]